jgi:Na+-transporting methylmalonyl-CoA/oxaloacetate decarboxylase beta subunit
MRDNSAATLKKKSLKIYVIGAIAFSGMITGIIFIKFLFSV